MTRNSTYVGPVLAALVIAAGVLLVACGSDDNGGGTGGAGGKKLILFELSFPCKLNEYATKLCDGVEDEAKAIADDFDVQIKTGKDFADNTGFNNLIQTSLQLDPSGLIVFPAGPAAQTPVLNKGCDQRVKVIIIDSPAKGVKCQVAFIGADHYHLGKLDGEWLIKQQPQGKEVGIVSLPEGQYESNDDRVSGFKETVEKAGYRVAGTAVTDLTLDKTRTGVTNLLTAHPDVIAIFSANSPMAQGTAQALKGNKKVLHLTVDGFLADIPKVLDGTLAADAAQDPYGMGRLAVRQMAQAIDGQKVPKETVTPDKLVDKENAQQFLDNDGLHGEGL